MPPGGLREPQRVERGLGIDPVAKRSQTMDKIDREIVRLLEDDARISFAELGERVGLSKTPCWQRVRQLSARV